jgi:hypothetical protein
VDSLDERCQIAVSSRKWRNGTPVIAAYRVAFDEAELIGGRGSWARNLSRI